MTARGPTRGFLVEKIINSIFFFHGGGSPDLKRHLRQAASMPSLSYTETNKLIRELYLMSVLHDTTVFKCALLECRTDNSRTGTRIGSAVRSAGEKRGGVNWAANKNHTFLTTNG
jgi:hypothetical protein